MTDKTRSIDMAAISLRDALDLAVLVEEEAKERYEELADQMEKHHNPEAAKFFRFMLEVEGKHETRLTLKRLRLFGSEPRRVTRAMIFDIEAPEYHEVRATMTVRQALEVSLRAEQKAFAFFDAAIANVQMRQVRDMFSELRDEERHHQALIEQELAKIPPDVPNPSPEEEEIVAL